VAQGRHHRIEQRDIDVLSSAVWASVAMVERGENRDRRIEARQDIDDAQARFAWDRRR
jgi:hypothetical protein